jgi:dipeptidyl aminopeptidase/acylaminoacyl peptidase
MYLIRTVASDHDFEAEWSKRPKGYPGAVNEAVQQMNIWDSAVEALSERGMIDPTKVGIIGYSRTGWYVEFALEHARTRYAAATVADSSEYSLSEYWMYPSMAKDGERIYGGPPYGKSLENWQAYSTSFNLDKIKAPLLIEEMGYGLHNDINGEVPTNLAIRYEIFSGLRRLGKAVEMYYYPEEQHQPDHPKARLASLERNLDWYRFWLLGVEDESPAKADQYSRWRDLNRLSEHVGAIAEHRNSK